MSDGFEVLSNVTVKVWLYYTPVLCCLATVGNFLCVFVSFRTEMRNMISRYYFTALAVSNEAAILFVLINWILGVTKVNVYDTGYCHATIYFPLAFRFMGVCFIIGFMIDRLQDMRYPPQPRALCTRGSAMMTIAGSTFLGLVEPTFFFFIHDSNCMVDVDQIGWQIGAFAVNAFVICYVPFVIIIALSIQIVKSIRGSATTGRILQHPTTDGTGDASTGQQSSSLPSAKQTHITKMLLTVAIVYVSLQLPSEIMLPLIGLGRIFDSKWITLTLLTVYQFFLLCMVTSFGITFFVCCAVNEDFRRAALATILLRRPNYSSVPQRIQYPCGNAVVPTSTQSHGDCMPPQGSTDLEMSPGASDEHSKK